MMYIILEEDRIIISDDYVNAEKDFTTYLGFNSEDTASYFFRGYSRLQLDKYDSSLSDLNKYISVINDFPNAYFDRAVCYFLMSDNKDTLLLAEQDYTKAIELDPEKTVYYYYRGKCRFELYDYENVIPDMDFVIENNPQDTFSYHYRGYSYKVIGEYEKAIEDFTTYLSLRPDNAVTYYNRGDTYQSLENYLLSVEDLTMAIALTLVITFSNVSISAMRNIIPGKIRMIDYLLKIIIK